LDLGVSNLQISLPERGFSFQEPGPLDMRMSPEDGESARELLARLDEQGMADLFRLYGEEPHARRIARGIVAFRERYGEIGTTEVLVEAIRASLPAALQRNGRGHPARRVFQALRIVVNDELGALREALEVLPGVCGPSGRAVIISYHSLEDRAVKRTFREYEADGLGRSIPRRAIVPDPTEIEANRKARSAKMRVFRFGEGSG
jgi:16S rRNA (cytosine1402-N4)-methyltransferase